MSKNVHELAEYIRSVPDWPQKGIIFRDITPLLGSTKALALAIQALSSDFVGENIDYVAAIEARGFIFGSAVAKELNAGFVPIRKKGKLPCKTENITYDLEYGTDTLEVHVDSINENSRVLMVDDLLATGGTMAAACKLMEKIGANIIATVFLVELSELAGREKLKDYKVKTIITY